MISHVQAFALTVHTGSDVFKPAPTLARILREVANQWWQRAAPRVSTPWRGPLHSRRYIRPRALTKDTADDGGEELHYPTDTHVEAVSTFPQYQYGCGCG